VFKRLVRLERSLEKELELDIANLKPRGTEIIPLFQDYGLARPEGGPRRIRTHLPDRVILLQALTLQMAYPLPPEKLDLEEAVKELYKTLEGRCGQRLADATAKASPTRKGIARGPLGSPKPSGLSGG
jgi:hypothetical protein